MRIDDPPSQEGRWSKRYRMRIDPRLCRSKTCGCERWCTTLFRCPGIRWNEDGQTAAIDDEKCLGCGACTPICPLKAIIKGESRLLYR